jgi:hypothetical protein
MKRCPQCSREMKGNFALCWKCDQTRREREARASGYADGYNAGYIEGRRIGVASQPAQTGMTTEMARRIRLLCHPDKHSNSKAATLATEWLNKVLK